MAKRNENKNERKTNDFTQSTAPEKTTRGINRPDIELPAFNPPVPNRAWTEMRESLGRDNVNPAEYE